MTDVCAIGHPLLDTILPSDDATLARLKLTKGRAHMLEEAAFLKIEEQLPLHNARKTPAGATANTLLGLARLGTDVHFFGKIGNDTDGEYYRKMFLVTGAKATFAKGGRTGKVISLVTPDLERTMIVNLGAATHLAKEDVDTEIIKNAKLLYMTAYKLAEPGLRKTAMHALPNAKQVAFDLADPTFILQNKDIITKVVDDYADILFMNEEEAKAFTGLAPAEAAEALSKRVSIVIIKLGKKGSLIRSGKETFKIPIYPVKAVDTTGAGDLYASGFIHAYLQDYALDVCGKLGSFIAGLVVSQEGAYFHAPIADYDRIIMNKELP